MDFRDDDLTHFERHGAAPPPEGTQGYVEFEGARIAYGVYGAGPPVVLLHGAFNHGGDFGHQIAALVGAGFRAVAVDSRGRGRSTLGARPLTYALLAEEVLAVMDALGIDRAPMVGWSDGAIIALTLAMTRPDRVARVFAFGAVMHLSGLKEIAPDDARLARAFARAKLDYARLSPTPDRFAEMAAEVGRLTSAEPNYRDADLARIAAPVAIVVGETDEFITREHTDHLARSIAGAERIVLPGVSHFALLQRPGEFNAAMLGFLRSERAQ